MKLASKIALLFVFVISTAKAQHDHSSHSHDDGAAHEHKAEPPHGGEIMDVGKYHFEIVFDAFTANEKLSVWILKSNFKVIDPKEFTGKVKIQYADGKETEKTLTVGMEKLSCNVEDITKAFTALIVVTIKGKEYHTTYNYKGLGK
jgi:hypothetical protein